MSVNTVQLTNRYNPQLLQGKSTLATWIRPFAPPEIDLRLHSRAERSFKWANNVLGENLLTEGNTATLTLHIPSTIQGPKRTESAKGRLWVTDRRVSNLPNKERGNQ